MQTAEEKSRVKDYMKSWAGVAPEFVNWNHPGFWASGCSTVPLVFLEPQPCHYFPMNQPRAPRGARPNRCPGHSAVIHWGWGQGPPVRSSGLFHLGYELQAAKGIISFMGSRVRLTLKFMFRFKFKFKYCKLDV